MKKIVISIVVILFIFLYARFVGTSGLKINEYKVVDSNITEDYHGLKIIQLSDIHFGSIVNNKKLEKIVEEINKLNPDIVTLTGDLIDERIKLNKEDIIKNLSNINAKFGKYAISGNHDIPIEDFNEIIEKGGFINLNNTYKLIYNGYQPIIISGLSSNLADNTTLDIKIKEFQDYLNSAKDKPIYSILLIHEPDFIDNLEIDNYNLILAGHSHGGQIRLPILGKIYTPNGAKKYYDEHYKINNTELFVSSGIGTSNLRLRLFNKPSFNFFRITNK